MRLQIGGQRVSDRPLGLGLLAPWAYTGTPATYALTTPLASRSNTTGNGPVIYSAPASFTMRLPRFPACPWTVTQISLPVSGWTNSR